MTANLALLAAVGVLVGTGVYLMTDRSLSRILAGVLLLGNGVNLMFLLAAGPAGRPAFSNLYPAAEISDPLPQAMVLTAVVITLATTAFLLAMAYRSFQLSGHDEVPDDVEDQWITARADADEVSSTYEESDTSQPNEDDTDPAAEDPHREPEDDDDGEDTPDTSTDGRHPSVLAAGWRSGEGDRR